MLENSETKNNGESKDVIYETNGNVENRLLQELSEEEVHLAQLKNYNDRMAKQAKELNTFLNEEMDYVEEIEELSYRRRLATSLVLSFLN